MTVTTYKHEDFLQADLLTILNEVALVSIFAYESLGKDIKMDNQTFHYIIRVPKEESAFTYFQLEAADGLCFYSTLESSMGQGYRDIQIKGHNSLKNEFDQVLEMLASKYPIEILSSK